MLLRNRRTWYTKLGRVIDTIIDGTPLLKQAADEMLLKATPSCCRLINNVEEDHWLNVWKPCNVAALFSCAVRWPAIADFVRWL